jgi:hypothetical protein
MGSFFFWKYFFILVMSQWVLTGKTQAQKKTTLSLPRSYYVDANGDDRNEGSLVHPWKTILPLQGRRLVPGDSALFRGGQTFMGTLRIDSGSAGKTASPIVVSSYGGGQARILSGDSSAMILTGTRFISIRNLKLEGSGRKMGNRCPGLAIVHSSSIYIDRLDISGYQKAGLLVRFSSEIRILNVYAHENGAAGIEVGGMSGKKDCNHIYIAHCLAEDNPGDPSNLTNHSGNGIVVGNCRNVVIEFCTATNNGWDMPRIGNGPVGIWAYEADLVTIQHCLSYRNKTSVGGADGGGFDLDGGVTRSVIQYCLSYENQGAGFCIFQYYYASPWHDNVFRFNISENDGSVSDAGGGLYVWNSSGDEKQFYNCLVYNNTIYNSRVAALSYSELSKRTNFAFYNNIFVGRDSLVKGNRGADQFQGNDWWSLSKSQGGKSSEKLPGLNLGPAFKYPGHSVLISCSGLKKFDSYRLSPGSPLRRAGADLHGHFRINTGNLDFNGHPVLSGLIGACF